MKQQVQGQRQRHENLFNSTEIYSLNGSKSVFIFTLAKSRLGGALSASMLLGYVGDAISKYPNLCTLQTVIRVNEDGSNIYLYVYSTHRVEEQKEAIEGYKSFLAEIEDIPKKSAEMSDVQTLLYLHDRAMPQ